MPGEIPGFAVRKEKVSQKRRLSRLKNGIKVKRQG